LPLIDLNAMSVAFYEAVEQATPSSSLAMETHHTAYGGLRACQVHRRRNQGQPDRSASYIVDDFKPFDPARPIRRRRRSSVVGDSTANNGDRLGWGTPSPTV